MGGINDRRPATKGDVELVARVSVAAILIAVVGLVLAAVALVRSL